MFQLSAFHKTEVIAGHEGLKKIVLNATFIDAPDGYKWCKNGDFIFTTGYPFTRKQNWEEELLYLLEMLAEKNCSGLGFKLGRYIPYIPKEVVSYADKKKLPIVALHDNLSWTDIINPIITQLNRQHQYDLEMTHKVYEQFHNHMEMKGDLQDLAHLLHQITNVPLTIYLRNFNKIINFPDSIITEKEIKDIISSHCYGKGQTIQGIELQDMDSTVRWINGSEHIEGGVFLWGVKSNLHTWEKAALEQTAVITSLEIERIRTVSTTFQRFRNDYLALLLNDSHLEPEVLFRRAKEVNWDLKDNYNVVLLDCNLSNYKGKNDMPLWQKKANILEEFKIELRWLLPDTLIGFDPHNRFTLLIPGEIEPETLQNKLERLITNDTITSFYGGIGRSNSNDNLSVSYNEAILALQVAYKNMPKKTNMNKKIPLYMESFNELNVERILFSESPRVEAENLAIEYLQEIMNYDKKRNSDLLTTLKAFLNHNANYDNTANALFLHKNTVRYRINIIRDLTNLDPTNTNDQLLLQMALIAIDALPRQKV